MEFWPFGVQKDLSANKQTANFMSAIFSGMTVEKKVYAEEIFNP